jgi:hypothetical protein
LYKATFRRNELLRSAFIATIGHYRTDQLVFMDESSKDECTLTRLYGYFAFGVKVEFLPPYSPNLFLSYVK